MSACNISKHVPGMKSEYFLPSLGFEVKLISDIIISAIEVANYLFDVECWISSGKFAI